MDDRMINLRDAENIVRFECGEWRGLAKTIIDKLEALPSAQPSATDTNVATMDTISRAATIDAFLTELTKRERKNFLHTWSTVEVKYFVADMLEKLPSSRPGWIYIEEALPKTIINEHTHDYQEYNCLCDFGDNGFDVRTYKFGNGHFWNGGGIVDKYVTAWQPLPEIPDALKLKLWEGGQDNA